MKQNRRASLSGVVAASPTLRILEFNVIRQYVHCASRSHFVHRVTFRIIRGSRPCTRVYGDVHANKHGHMEGMRTPTRNICWGRGHWNHPETTQQRREAPLPRPRLRLGEGHLLEGGLG